MIWEKQLIPKWAEKRILAQYNMAIKDVERWRRTVNMESATGGQLAQNLRRYSYTVGKVAVLEELMDKLFIEYDNHGRVKELPL
jgi:hypothetical protein